MMIDVHPDGPRATTGIVCWTDGAGELRSVPCRLGRAGVAAAAVKREGDGATPAGIWPLRRVHVRDDRVADIQTGLEARAITADDGWCDDAGDAAYNTRVRLPFAASHEAMWRDDGLYDVVVELGYNDDPALSGKGSAIFMHVMAPDKTPTEGCVALALADLLDLLEVCDNTTCVRIHVEP